MTKTNLVIGITFAAFLVEALFHYQLGAWQDDGPIQFPQIVLPDTNNTTFDFTAYVTDLGMAIPFEDKVTATVTLKITGQITMTS